MNNILTTEQDFLDYQNCSIVITGGLGFIGSSLARQLALMGAKVSIIDNMHPNGGGNYFNIETVADKVNIHSIDIQDSSGIVSSLIKESQYVFHLAGLTGHMDSMHLPFADLKNNAEATLKLLEMCRLENPKIRFVYASTRQLYGRPHYLPVDEVHPISPVDINGIHKFLGEQYVNLYHRFYSLPTTILRLTNVYGPGLRIKDAKQMFLGIWIRNCIEGKPFEVWDGDQIRDLAYVDDVRDAFLMSALSEATIGDTYNVGGSENLRLDTLAKIFAECSPKKVNYMIKAYPADRKSIEIGNIYLNYQKLTNVIGWCPKIDIKTGLQLTFEYYQQHFENYTRCTSVQDS